MAEAAANMQCREERSVSVSSEAGVLASRNMLWVRVKTAFRGKVGQPATGTCALQGRRADYGVLGKPVKYGAETTALHAQIRPWHQAQQRPFVC
jgi:hypothetical protein